MEAEHLQHSMSWNLPWLSSSSVDATAKPPSRACESPRKVGATMEEGLHQASSSREVNACSCPSSAGPLATAGHSTRGVSNRNHGPRFNVRGMYLHVLLTRGLGGSRLPPLSATRRQNVQSTNPPSVCLAGIEEMLTSPRDGTSTRLGPSNHTPEPLRPKNPLFNTMHDPLFFAAVQISGRIPYLAEKYQIRCHERTTSSLRHHPPLRAHEY